MDGTNGKVNLFTMNAILRSMTRFDHLLAEAEAAVLITLVAVMTLIVFLQRDPTHQGTEIIIQLGIGFEGVEEDPIAIVNDTF